MEPLILFIVCIITMGGACISLLHYLDLRNSRRRLAYLEDQLNAELQFAPEPWADDQHHRRYDLRCKQLRNEMQLIIDRHSIHPFDSIKPF